MIDNYDPKVFRNDQITIEKIKRLKPDQIVISPGPCTPREAGISNEVIRAFSGKIPILGVCLGHQCIGDALGGKIIRAKRIMHGKTSPVLHDNRAIFKNIPNPFAATRYHSLLIEKKSIPPDLIICAWTKEGEIMGVRHKHHPTWGVQFHPESIMTQSGKEILANFLRLSKPQKKL